MIEIKVLVMRLPTPSLGRGQYVFARGAFSWVDGGVQSVPIVQPMPMPGVRPLGMASLYEQDNALFADLRFEGELSALSDSDWLRSIPETPEAAGKAMNIRFKARRVAEDFVTRTITQAEMLALQIYPRSDPDAWTIAAIVDARGP